MNLLLDTHVLLWWLNDDPLLSKKPCAVIADGKNLVFVSAASIWEIRIKEALKKLKIPRSEVEIPSIYLREPATLFLTWARSFSRTKDGSATIAFIFWDFIFLQHLLITFSL